MTVIINTNVEVVRIVRRPECFERVNLDWLREGKSINCPHIKTALKSVLEGVIKKRDPYQNVVAPYCINSSL